MWDLRRDDCPNLRHMIYFADGYSLRGREWSQGRREGVMVMTDVASSTVRCVASRCMDCNNVLILDNSVLIIVYWRVFLQIDAKAY